MTLSKQKHSQILSQSSTTYNGIDLVKFLCALMVFIIHVPPFPAPNSVFANNLNFGLRHGLCRIAVPFFFLSSGFFLFGKMPLDKINIDIIRNYCYKILRLLGIWTILTFIGEHEYLWYLGATVVAIVLLSLCLYFHINIRYIGIFAIALYMIGLLGDSYYGLTEPLKSVPLFSSILRGYNTIFETTRNGVFMGFIFILMGAWFAHHKISLSPVLSSIGLIASLICLLGEVFWLKQHSFQKEYNMYIFLLPAVYFLFSLAVNVQLNNRPIYNRLRKLSMLIYFSHILINEFAWVAVNLLNKLCADRATEYQFVISLSLTLLSTICIERLSCKKHYKWINWLIS